MSWTDLIKSEMDHAFRATEGLMDLVDDDGMAWTPATGENWMSMGALLRHLTNACGWCSEQFVNDSWAEAMGGGGMDESPVATAAEAKAALSEDRLRGHAAVDKAGEDALVSRMTPAPWDPTPRPLGQQILQMVTHLQQHKGQLFYYLKLQGKPVNTFTMWGIAEPPAS